MTRPAGLTSRGLLWVFLLGFGTLLVVLLGAGSASADDAAPGETPGPVAGLLSDTVDPIAKPVTGALKPATDPVVKPVDETLKPVTAPVKKAVDPVTKPVANSIEPVAAPVRKAFEPASEAVEDIATRNLKPITESVSNVALEPALTATAPVVNTVAPIVHEVAPTPAPPTADAIGPTPSVPERPAADSPDKPAPAVTSVELTTTPAPVDTVASQDAAPPAMPLVFGGGSIPSDWPTSPMPGASTSSSGSSMMQLPVVAQPSLLTSHPAVLIGLSSPRDVVQKSQDASRPETSPG